MIKNEDGLVKCLTEKGNVRWLSEHLAIDAKLLNSIGLIVAPSPKRMDAIIKPIEEKELEVAQDASAVKKRQYTKNK